MSAHAKWRREVRAMAEGEGFNVVGMTVNGSGHIACHVSIAGASAIATVSSSPGCWRAPKKARSYFRRLARSLKQNAR